MPDSNTASNHVERTANQYIPYTRDYDEHTCGTIDGDLVQTIRVAGVPFETLDNADINGLNREWFAALNNLSTKSSKVAMWTHLRKKRLRYDLSSIEYDNWFSSELGAKFAQMQQGKTFFVMEMHVSLVWRTAPGKTDRLAKKMPGTQAERESLVIAGMAELEKVVGQMMTTLRRYHPRRLGVTKNAYGDAVSEQAMYFASLIGARDDAQIGQHASVHHAIQTCDMHFGEEVFELQGVSESAYGAIVSLKTPYGIGDMEMDSNLLHGLYGLDVEFDLSQSLTFQSVADADGFLDRQISQYASTPAHELLVKELQERKKKLQAGHFGVANHEFTLVVRGATILEVNRGVIEIEGILTARTFGVVRERRAMMITQLFGTLPGNFLTHRLCATPIGTDNIPAFYPMHAYATGNAKGSQWGMPIAFLTGAAGGPKFVNFHVSKSRLADQGINLEYEPDEEAEGAQKVMRKDSANVIYIGDNGSGKTMMQCLFRALLHSKGRPGKRPYKSFAFDFDNGQEILICALGGVYFRFDLGEPSGVAPFAMENTPGNRQFLMALAQWCAAQDKTYKHSGDDSAALQRAIGGVYALDKKEQRWARLLDLLTNKGAGTLHDALLPWVDDGNLAWVLDGGIDALNFDAANDFGFDMTQILTSVACVPVQMCVLHMIRQHAAGSPHSIDIEEASSAAKDPVMLSVIEENARRIRKKDGSIALLFQNAADLSGVLSATLLGQFQTRFIFPNASAQRAHYPFLSDREFELVRDGMNIRPGQFLMQQGRESSVVDGDMTALGGDLLSVLSGSIDNVLIARECIAMLGSDPKAWLPEYYKRRR